MGGEWASEGDLENLDNLEWGVGGGVFLGNSRFGGMDVETTSVNLNGILKTKGFAVAGEWFTREDDINGAPPKEDSDGWQLTGSWTTAPASTQYSIVAGVSQITQDQTNTILTGSALGTGAGDLMEISLGVNMYYHAHNMKTEVAYVYQDVDPDAGGDTQNDIFIIQISLLF